MSYVKFDQWSTRDDVVLPSVVQTVFATSGFVDQTITSTTPVMLTGMRAAIKPVFSDSLIVVRAMLNASFTYVCGVHIYRNNIDLISVHGGNNQSGGDSCLWTHYQSSQESARAQQLFTMPITWVDRPYTNGVMVYDIRANSGWGGGTETFYFNNRTGADMLGCSTLLIQEIQA